MQQERSFADVVSQGKMRKARIFMGDSIIRKVDKIVNRGNDITVCLPGAKNRGCSREGRTGHGWWHGRCCSRATNNAEKEGTLAIVGKYRRLVKTLRGTNWTDCIVRDITSNGRQG